MHVIIRLLVQQVEENNPDIGMCTALHHIRVTHELRSVPLYLIAFSIYSVKSFFFSLWELSWCLTMSAISGEYSYASLDSGIPDVDVCIHTQQIKDITNIISFMESNF